MAPALTTRVLIVDDNRDAADLLNELLTLHGYTACTAYDGVTALEAALVFEPQIVILDLDMPKYSGIKVAPMLRQVRKLQDVYIIALTSWGDHESRAMTRRNGFNLHLAKAVQLPELLAALELGHEAHALAVRAREREASARAA